MAPPLPQSGPAVQYSPEDEALFSKISWRLLPLLIVCYIIAFLDRVNIVSQYDRVIRSPNFEMRLPSVISLKEYVPTERRPAFTRFNVFLRDRFHCQYCGEPFPTHDLTFDHVVPRSRGGR